MKDLISVEFFKDYVDCRINEWNDCGDVSVSAVVKGFLKGGNLVYDSSAEGLAFIDSITFKQVTINPTAADEILKKNASALISKFQLYSTGDRSQDIIIVSNFCSKFVLGLFCHEYMHACESPLNVDSEAAIKANPNLIEELAFFCINVVEDCYIQPALFRTCHLQAMLDAMKVVEFVIQGPAAIPDFISSHVAAEAEISSKIHHELFYFILLAYNPENANVANKFSGVLIPELCWKQDTIDKFNEVVTIGTTSLRLKKTVEEFVPLVQRDLGDISMPQGQQNQQGSGQQGQGQGQGIGYNETKPSKELISKIASELNKQLHSSNDKGSVSSVSRVAKEALQRSSYDISMEDILSSVTENISKVGLAANDKSNSIEFSSELLSAYCRMASTFARLYNEVRDSRDHLTSGRIDRKRLVDYVARSAINIFKEETAWVNEKNIDLCMIGDTSGSMSDSVDDIFSIMSVICSALQKAKIKSACYTFASSSRLVKDFDNPCRVVDGNSDLLTSLVYGHTGGGTNLLPCLRDYYARLQSGNKINENNVHVVFVLTDGATSNSNQCKYLCDKMRSLGVAVIGIGLDCRKNDDTYLCIKHTIGNCSCYSRDEYTGRLMTDIFNVMQALLRRNILR